MKVTMLLADHAAAENGKLYVNGGGWTITGPEPVPSAIALLIDVPWDQTNRKHTLRLELVDADGQSVIITDSTGARNDVQLGGEFELGRPPGVTPGTPLTMPVALNFGPIPLPLGERFAWNLFIDGETHQDWVLPFSTRAI